MLDIARALNARGTSHVFGHAEADASPEFITAIHEFGLTYVHTSSHLSAAIMASTQADMTGGIGAVLIPDGAMQAAAAINGLLFAMMESMPLLAITTATAARPAGPGQTIDQQALFGPFVKEGRQIADEDATAGIDQLLTIAKSSPAGPVHLRLGRHGHAAADSGRPATVPPPFRPPQPAPEDLRKAKGALAMAQRPVVVIGMEARLPGSEEAIATLAETLACPVLTTPKAKGVLNDRHPLLVGPFSGGQAEDDLLNAADLIITCGLDPRETMGRAWTYTAPVIELSPWSDHLPPLAMRLRLVGDMAQTLAELAVALERKSWQTGEITAYRARLHSRLAQGQRHRRSAKSVIETARRLAPPSTRLVVDNGPYRQSTLAFWPSDVPYGVLTPKTSAVSGYALPAAIASCLCAPESPVLAVTNAAGLIAHLGDLAAATAYQCPLTILVMNDGPGAANPDDMRSRLANHSHQLDFAAIARGFDIAAWPAGINDTLGGALSEAQSHPGPSLVDVTIDANHQ